MQGLLSESDFQWLAAELGLDAEEPTYKVLYQRCLYNLDARGIARTLGLTDDEAQFWLETAAHLWHVRSQKAGSVRWYRDLLTVMQGTRSSCPGAPLVGFDKHYPGDPAHAQVVAVRAKMITAEDLARGERAWREISPIEEAQRGKKARRLKRQRKERKQ